MKTKILIMLAALSPFFADAELILINEGETAEEATARYWKRFNERRAYSETRSRTEYSGAALYYCGKRQDDYAQLAASPPVAAVSNILAEMNGMPDVFRRLGYNNTDYKPERHKARRRLHHLQNELFELGAIPALKDGGAEWVDGMVLATNGFAVSDEVREVLLSLNWFEQNENPFHAAMYGTNAVQPAGVSGAGWCRDFIAHNGHSARFDRNFEIWRINEKLEFDKDGNLATKFDVNGNIISKRNATEGGAAPK